MVSWQNNIKNIYGTIGTKTHNNLSSILDCLEGILQYNVHTSDSIYSDLISKELLEEIKIISSNKRDLIYFGKTLCDLKCVIKDEESHREHLIFIRYKAPRKLIVTSVNFPYSSLQDQEYNTIEEIVIAFKQYLEDLSGYFLQLECIDKCCTVMEPVSPSFKEGYRRILLDDRTWLHVEVTREGLATNIHLIGHSEFWQDKLQEELLKWDHDVNIVQNIMHIFDITEFPTLSDKATLAPILEKKPAEKPPCSICLCDELPDVSGVPLPLCRNSSCGMYFHRTCLFQWLLACAGGRPPAFGVATGSCPSCLHPISCNEKDS